MELRVEDDIGDVELNIRSPVSTIPDLRIVCPLDWKVIRLKERISELFPGNPQPKVQKLLYAGKMLEDRERLQEFIRFEDECSVYTMHLVCSIQNDWERTELKSRKAEAIEPAAIQQNYTSTDAVNVYTQQYLQISNQQFQLSEDNLQQIAALQEMYSQYLIQYIQYMQTSFPGHQPNIQVPRVEGEGLDAGRVAVNAGDAAPGAQGPQEPGLNRDTLDWLYICMRILILVSIVYFYSSFYRLILVAVIFLVLYSFQVGMWQFDNLDHIQQEVNNIRGQQQQPQRDDVGRPLDDVAGGPLDDGAGGLRNDVAGGPRNDVAGGPRNNVAGGPRDDVIGGPDDDVAGGPRDDVTPRREHHQRPHSLLDVLATFFISFFTSILPEPQQIF